MKTFEMNINIPYIQNRTSSKHSSNPAIVPITQGDFVKAIQHIWNKFSFNNGINLSPFRHNLRGYFSSEGVAITPYELQTIRGLLSDPNYSSVFPQSTTAFDGTTEILRWITNAYLSMKLFSSFSVFLRRIIKKLRYV